MIDVKGSGLSGPNSLQDILSTFSVSGMTAGWTVDEKTYINGVLQADTGVFTGVSDSASALSSAFLGTTFMAEEIYTIHSFGKGDFNGGIVLSVAAVPEASTWAMLLLGFAGIGLMGLRKSRAGQAFRQVVKAAPSSLTLTEGDQHAIVDTNYGGMLPRRLHHWLVHRLGDSTSGEIDESQQSNPKEA